MTLYPREHSLLGAGAFLPGRAGAVRLAAGPGRAGRRLA